MIVAIIILSVVVVWLTIHGIVTRNALNELHDLFFRHIQGGKSQENINTMAADSFEILEKRLNAVVAELRKEK